MMTADSIVRNKLLDDQFKGDLPRSSFAVVKKGANTRISGAVDC
jgi:hypothetical protein